MIKKYKGGQAELQSRINEIIAWINNHEDDDKGVKKKMDGMVKRAMEMREVEHKMAMETAKASLKMMKKMT